VLDNLAGLKLPENCALHDQAVGLFLEKCLKFAVECADKDTVTQLARVVERKVVSPIAWHRNLFRMFWTWKVRRGKLEAPPYQGLRLNCFLGEH
jgi:hypothetical protein